MPEYFFAAATAQATGSHFPWRSPCTYLSYLRLIFQINKALASVSRVNHRSSGVAAKTLPMVLSTNNTKKIHRRMVTVLFPSNERTMSTRCSTKKIKNKLMPIEAVSNTYISPSVFNLPPQVMP